MDKPLKDWTLEEAQAYCKNHEGCLDCLLDERLICGSPNCWDLADKPEYTDDEIALAKLLMKAGVEAVQKDGLDGTTMLWTSSEKFSRVDVDLFPSVELMSNQIELKDIAESKARNG